MDKTAKTLYFEGAGWSGADISKATIGNCRIRTAFHLDNGRAVYLEIIGSERTKYCSKKVYEWQYTGFVDSCHYITNDKDNKDENKHSIIRRNKKTLEYSEEGILQYVNSLGASFTAIKVLPDLSGYQVFRNGYSTKGMERYNYGDEFVFDTEMIARREQVYKKIYEIEQSEGKRFPNVSLWVDQTDPCILHLVRHFNGYNKHWAIRTDIGETIDEWIATAQETYLGAYGC